MSQTIEVTRDYSLFQTIVGNRKVRDAHIKRLKDSIGRTPEPISVNAILINDKNEIIDGQHRFEAIKELDLPVYYIKAKGLGLDDVQILNANQRGWTPKDYAKSYSKLGNKDYDTYLEFDKEFGLNHDTLLSYLATGNNVITRPQFDEGKMKIEDKEGSRLLCEQLADAGKFYLDGDKKYKKRAFTTAFKKMWENPSYDHAIMMVAMEKRGYTLEDYAQWQDAVRAIENIYNKHQRNQVRFF